MEIIQAREQTRAKAERTAAIYANMLMDILQGKNLDKHLADVNKGIAVIDVELLKMKEANIRTDSIEEFRNNLFRLVYLIGETT